jgi:hypothetical protein
MEIRGNAMPLGTGTGAAQTWDFTSLFGGVIRHMTYVEVEETAGSGVYMPWPVIDEDPKFNLDVGTNTPAGGATPAAFSAGNTLAGRALFWHETNRTLRCGDGTNGAVVPTGCAVRIPNIYISNRLLTNQTFVFNISVLGTPTGGSFVLEFSRENGQVLGTATIPYNSTAAAVDTLIEAVTGTGTVTAGSGPLPGAAVSITWTGVYANERLGVRVVSQSLTGGTNPQAICNENLGTNLSLIDLNPLGTFDAEWVSFSHKIRCVVDVFKSFRAKNVGFGSTGIQLNNSNGSVDLDGLSISRSPFEGQGRSQVFSVLGPIRASRVVTAGKNPAADFIFQTTPGLSYADRIYSYIYGTKNSANNRSLQFITVPSDLVITNIGGLGAPFSFQNTTNIKVVNIAYADTTLVTQQTTHGTSAIVTSNCVNPIFANIFNGGAGAPRFYTISTDSASAGLKIFGANLDAGNNTSGILMQCSGMELRNVKLTNARSGPLIDLPTTYLANNLTAKKFFATFATAQITGGLDACQGGIYDIVSSTVLGINESFAGVNDFVGGNYAEASLTPTTGHVTFGPFGEGVGLELTGAAFTDALGAFFMPEAGDTATITMPFAMHGITSFQNVNPLLYVDVADAAANQAVLAAPSAPTGGTFTLSVYDASGTFIDTTAAIAYNANGTAIATAIHSIAGIGTGNVACSNSLSGSGVITFQAALAGQAFIVTIDGSSLTGNTQPVEVYGRARLMNGNEKLGANIAAEFAVRKPGTSWPAYQALTGSNLAAAIPALTGYAPGGAGLEMRIKLTTSVTSAYTKFNQISLPTTIDPDLWFVGDATITFTNVGATDTVELRKVAGDVLITTFTGGGTHELDAIENFGASVYLVRKNAGGTLLKSTISTPFNLTVDDNGTFDLTAVTLKNADGSAMSSFVIKNGISLGWIPLATERVLQASPGDVLNVYAHGYGMQPKLVTIVGNTPSDFVLSLVPETFVDTTQANRDTIAAAFGNGLDAFERFYLSVNTDLRQYTPAQVLHALHWHILTQGALVGAAAILAGDLNGFALQRGGFAIRTAGFYGKVADSVTTVGDLGMLVPLSIYVDDAVYVEMPTYTPVVKNTSGIVLQYAPWTQQEADVPSWVAKEVTVATRATQTSVDAIPTLAEIEASTVIAKEASVSAIKAKTDKLSFNAQDHVAANVHQVQAGALTDIQNGLARESTVTDRPTLTQIEASTVLAKAAALASLASINQTEHDATQAAIAALPAPLDATETQAAASAALAAYDPVVPADLAGLATSSNVSAAQAAIIAEVDAIPTNPLLANDARLDNLDTTISSRLAATGYTTPPTVSAIRADIERAGGMLDTVPTLTEIEGSTVLAKQSGFTGLATASNVTASQSAIITEINANEAKIDAVKTDTAAIKAKTDSLPASPAATGDIPTAASNAAAVRTNLAAELARIDVTVSTRESAIDATDRAADIQASIASVPAAPTASTVATEVRTELATELARIDTTISSRNAVTPPTVAQIRTEMDANSTKLANLDTAVSSRSTQESVNKAVSNSALAAALSA